MIKQATIINFTNGDIGLDANAGNGVAYLNMFNLDKAETAGKRKAQLKQEEFSVYINFTSLASLKVVQNIINNMVDNFDIKEKGPAFKWTPLDDDN